MTFIDAIRVNLANYFGFHGRARRKEYWYFTLFCAVGTGNCARRMPG
jgi:uncharacterized membrane protein YhaH (DUF805 family)